MNLYIYSDNDKRTWIKDKHSFVALYCPLSRQHIFIDTEKGCGYEAETVFEVECEDILEADKALEDQIGIKRAKSPYIGCEICPLIFEYPPV